MKWFTFLSGSWELNSLMVENKSRGYKRAFVLPGIGMDTANDSLTNASDSISDKDFQFGDSGFSFITQ